MLESEASAELKEFLYPIKSEQVEPTPAATGQDEEADE